MRLDGTGRARAALPAADRAEIIAAEPADALAYLSWWSPSYWCAITLAGATAPAAKATGTRPIHAFRSALRALEVAA